jgi:hypothetical protein
VTTANHAETLVELVCPGHGLPLAPSPGGPVAAAEALLCPSGCRFAVVGAIPRFVATESYAEAFGRQWKRFARTQLDSYTGTTVSRDRLARCLGDLGRVASKTVLEAGCGAGRFSEVLLQAGASVSPATYPPQSRRISQIVGTRGTS